MMKKTIIILLFAAMCLPAFAAKIGSKFKLDYLEYKVLTANTVEVAALKEKKLTEIDVPENVVYEGQLYTVVGIGPKAFAGCSISRIAFPNTIKYIAEWGLASMINLRSANLGYGIEQIGRAALAATPQLTILDFPSKLNSIGESAFANSGITEVILPQELVTIDKDAFKDCKNLGLVVIPPSIRSIGNSAFKGCDNLFQVFKPAHIPKNKFDKIKNIKFMPTEAYNNPDYQATASDAPETYMTTPTGNVETAYEEPARQIVESSTKIGDKFEIDKMEYKVLSPTTVELHRVKDKDRTEVIIPANVTVGDRSFTVVGIGERCFERTSTVKALLFGAAALLADKSHEVERIEMPATIKYVGRWAINSLPKLREVVLSSSLEEIEFAGLAHNPELMSINLPPTLKTIGESAFDHSGIVEAIIPPSVITIGDKAFNDCKNLSLVVIPESVRAIGKKAFNNCNNLFQVYKPRHIPVSKFHKPKNITFLTPDEYKPSATPATTYYATNTPAAQRHTQESPQPATTSRPATTPPSRLSTTPVSQSATAQTARQHSTVQSDVDINIPKTSIRNENTFAVVIANEDYMQEVPVKFANNDGTIFTRYLTETLGLPESNVRFVANATRNQIVMQIDWLKKVSNAYSGDLNIIFYYAGHGVPDESTNNAYLIPVDGSSTNSGTCMALESIYADLGKMNAKNITVIMDACFSGAQRGNGMLMAARGVAIKAKPSTPKGKMVVLSATQDDETAYPYDEKGHGLFTYYLLKKLQETSGKVTYGDLSDYIKSEVGKRSIVVNNKSQTPNVLVSPQIARTWRTKSFGK